MAGNVVAVTIALLTLMHLATTARADSISPRRSNLTARPSYASKAQSSHERQAHAAVSASLAQAKSALAAISSAAKSVAPLKPGEGMVLRDCFTTMGDSVQKLQKSQDAMGGAGGKSWVQNARTWVSAALTEENMCADELRGVDLAGRREAIRGMVAAAQCSNALALISGLDSAEGINAP